MKILRTFYDGQDESFLYNIGDVYPREGTEVNAERVKYLADLGYIEKDMTVADIKAELDAKGIEYDPKSKKAELQALLEG